MQCSECKGSGFYIGFQDKEFCRECGGAGWVGDDVPADGTMTHFGVEEIKKGLHPPFVCFDFPSCFGTAFESVKGVIGSMENVLWVYLLRGEGESGNWIRYDRSVAGEDLPRSFFKEEADAMYALYRRVDGGSNAFKLVDKQ